MGQPITVVEKPSAANPAVLRLETNRPLSGMGHEPYEAPPDELLQRPVDELARRLFAAGGVQRVHINGSVVTVTLAGGQTGEGLADIVRQLFLHYGDTPSAVAPTPLAEADAAPEALADPADAPAAQEAADDAPAPDRPADEPAAEQEIPGIPNAEVAPEEAPPVEREPSAAEPEEVAAAAESAAEPAPAPTTGTGGANEATDDVAPTPGVERPVAEPLAAHEPDRTEG